MVTHDIPSTIATQPRGNEYTFVPETFAANAPQMLDALNEVNDYLSRYERREQEIGYVFRSRHAVREAITNATTVPAEL